MHNNPLIATIIEVVIIAAFIYGLVKVIKPFFFTKKQAKETIHRSARNQSNLIDRRIKK